MTGWQFFVYLRTLQLAPFLYRKISWPAVSGLWFLFPGPRDSAEPRDDFATSRESDQEWFVTVSNRFAEQKFHRHFRIAFCARKCDLDEKKKDRETLAVKESYNWSKVAREICNKKRAASLLTYFLLYAPCFPCGCGKRINPMYSLRVVKGD